MKFGKQLEEYEQPEWRGHYINYRHFKNLLQEIKDARDKPAGIVTPTILTPLVRRPSGLMTSVGSVQNARDAESGETLDLEAEWRRVLTKEALRVGDFVHRGLEGLEAQLRDLDKMSQTLVKKRQQAAEDPAPELRSQKDTMDSDGEGEDEAEEFLELRTLEALGLVGEGGRRLRGFAEINHAALYKILKKHDKVLKMKTGLGELLPKLVEETKLGEMDRFDVIDEELRRLSLLSSQTEGLNASENVARLAAGLGMGPSTGLGAAPMTNRYTELLLSFFLGCSTALFLCIGVLLALPEASPKSFSTAYFLTSMPVFRVIFTVLLSLWCMGAVARTCDKADINHMFILNVDPRCRTRPEWFFSRAAVLTTSWILVFGMYVVDYKWRVLPPIWSNDGYNKRSSVVFVLYPLILVCLTLFGAILPSRVCRTRYKVSLLRAIVRCVLAPLYVVDFSDNMVGDIMTSMIKPLQDATAAMCYVASPHPQTFDEVVLFVDRGDTCSLFTHHVLLPIIGGLPYSFRALQCLRRYRDTGEVRNLWNFGKYLASLAVVVVSSAFFGNWYAIVVVSTVATVYAATWDIVFDWGLGWRELHIFAKPQPQPSPGEATSARERAASASSGKVGDHLSGKVGDHLTQRHFSPKVYLLCCILDVAARSTWVLTLMPITIISRNIVGRVILVSIISSVEILRRSMWAVLRIEHEQTANASGFRALLWVPSKLNAAGRRDKAPSDPAGD